jgi:DNA segregation ATPase FtsK/SpoIIIE-like protein
VGDQPLHRHNGGPLSDEDAEKLWGHIRALEVLAEQKQEVADDEKARKALAKADGFDTKVLAAIMKRRQLGEGETKAADTLIRIYEEALQEQGALPLEQSKRTAPPVRRSVEEVAQQLHGQEAPPGLVKESDDVEGFAGLTVATADVLLLYDRAVDLVRTHNKASTSWLQRELRVGYNSAARIVEKMEARSVITYPDHLGRRTVVDPYPPRDDAHKGNIEPAEQEDNVPWLEGADEATRTVPSGAAGRVSPARPEMGEALFD